MQFKRTAVAVLLTLLAVTSVFAQKTTINFWTWRPEDVETYDKLIAIFEKANPGIKIVQTAHKSTDYNTILSAALSGGSGPDVFQSRAYGGLETFAQSGFLEPVEKWVPEVKSFDKGPLRGATSIKDGKIYGVPFASQTLFVFYNKALYKELGLSVPETWEQFIGNLQAMKKAGIQPLANGGKDGWTLEVMMGSICPNFYGANDFFDAVVAGKTTFQDPRFVGAIAKLKELTPFMPELYMGVAYTDAQSSFINEVAGHFIGGSFEAGYFSAQNPKLDYDVFAAPVAKKGDPHYVSVYADGNFSMNAAGKNKEAAAKFLRFLAGKDTGNAFIKELKQVSAVPGVDTSTSPYISKVLSLQKYNTPYLMLVGFRYQQPTGSVLIQAALQGFMAGKFDAAEVAKQVQEGIATYYAPFKK
ncbi:MAG TPA: extracellular solute-binding protein [Rectinemataceae bacterium]|nr:extracellular solute-binding protein [Rectinemataceae bacterium]